mmetsp:Transcript_81372/g.226621  ORF Transcript_81372/g.226621 Transcript_81372/m.226621 type:complete len:232 (-) Transcript_81372:111-806(-)
MEGGGCGGTNASGGAARSVALGRLFEEVEALPAEEVWRVRVFAGLRRVIHERRKGIPGGSGSGFIDLLEDETGIVASILGLLGASALAALDATRGSWRRLSQWRERWYLLGVENFGQRRRLVPPGRFERFDEAVLEPSIDWQSRYCNFVMAAHCDSIESLRMAAIRVVQSVDLENCGVDEVQRRLVAELRLAPHFLSIECVEQLLEEASSLRSVVGGPRPPDTPPPDDGRN